MSIQNKNIGEVMDSVSQEWREFGLLIGTIIALGIIFSILSPYFLTIGNFVNVIRQSSLVIVLSLGMTYVIVCAEIDVSIGGIMGFSAVLAALGINAYGPIVGIVIGIGVGILIGTLNGVITVWFGIPSFIVTIGMLGATRGAALVVSNASPITVGDSAVSSIFNGSVIGIPNLVIWAFALTIIAALGLSKTKFGRHVYATGDSEQAAVYSGIDTNKVKVLALAVSGLCAGIAALLFIARLGVARPGMESGIELSVIAAVIIGGTSLFGGRGTILGTILGALLISEINNGLTLLGYGQSWQQLIRGIVIIVAVSVRASNEDGEWL